jgi:tetratricopeptide (TPR) repeat protein
MKPFSIAAFLQQARQYTPRTRQIRAVAHTPAQAAPGEVWLTKAPGTVEGEPEEPLTVLLLERFEGDAGEPTLFTGAPIFNDPRMAGPADAVLPREILGFEAGIAFASAASLFAESLVACEGALPEVWITRLAAFYGYVRGVAKSPPPEVTTGAPYIDENDPAFVFHEDLAEQMQALATPALEWATAATDDMPEEEEFVDVRATQDASEAAFEESLALAASEREQQPEIVRVDDLLAGFQGEATGDGCAPSEASTLRLAFTVTTPESPRPAEVPVGGVIAVWPTGQTEPHGFTHRSGRWRANIRLPLPWPETVALLREKKIRIEPVISTAFRVENLKLIYSDAPDVRADALLADARDLLAGDSRAAIPEWLEKHPPLVADLRAQVATGKARPCRRAVALKVVFIDEGGRGQGRLGELLMEQIADATATGELYPAASMAGVRTDAAWDGALTAAFWYAREHEFGIAPGRDVRWTVNVLPPGESWDEGFPEHTPSPLRVGDTLTGRSAGVAFFLGLFALAQGEGSPGVWDARKVVERMVALATLPKVETRTATDPLETLGGEEAKKRAVLAALPMGTPIMVIFPGAYTGSILGKHEPLMVSTVAALAEELRQQCRGSTRPDAPQFTTRRALRYIGGMGEVTRLRQALRDSRLHVVTGPGGVGKTARVIEAAETLWREGMFPGGRFWIDLYGDSKAGRRSVVAAAEAVAKTCGERPAEKLDDLRDQASRLLRKQPSLVLLEGAEMVAKDDMVALVELFPIRTTLVWMTRRETDAQHSSLRSATHHAVRALSPADALELLCYTADRKLEEMSATERADWEEIAKATERLPLLLGWAGAALQPDRLTTAAQYLGELRADPLGEIADPDAREQRNAGRFLRRSLARIVATAEMPDLPAVAERLFAGLAAFHPSYGAPLTWWPLAAGLDATKSEGRRRLAAARRALLELGLVTAQASLPVAGATAETLHAVHALAGVVAADLWRKGCASLGALCQAATAALDAPLPPQWFRDAAWVVRRTAEAAHYGHWFGEMETWALPADPEALSAEALLQRWVDFLETHAELQPLLALKDTAWMAVCRHFQQIVAVKSNMPDLQRRLSNSWIGLGDVRMARYDWIGAKAAFSEAMEAWKKLAEAHPDTPDFQHGLSVSWGKLGGVCVARNDWVAAEAAFNNALKIDRELAETHPDALNFQYELSVWWGNLGDVRSVREDWVGAEAAFLEAKAIRRTLAKAHPDVRKFQGGLAVAWSRLGQVREALQDWAGAEAAFNNAMAVSKKLAAVHPDVPSFQQGLAASWIELAQVREALQDWVGAEAALNNAMAVSKKLAAEHPDVPGFQQDLSASWIEMGKLCQARQDWAGAEVAFINAFEIDKKLAGAHPDVPSFQLGLSHSWWRIGRVRMERQDWAGAEMAYNEGMAISKNLAEAHPDAPDFQKDLFDSRIGLGSLCQARQDWAGAEAAFNNAMVVSKKLAAEHPDMPRFQQDLSVAWIALGQVREALQDWAGAEAAFNNAMVVSKKLAAEHPDVPKFKERLAVTWGWLGNVREARHDRVGAEAAFKNAAAIRQKLADSSSDVQEF